MCMKIIFPAISLYEKCGFEYIDTVDLGLWQLRAGLVQTVRETRLNFNQVEVALPHCQPRKTLFFEFNLNH